MGMGLGCMKCKGRGFCGKVSCPLIAKSHAQAKVVDLLKSTDIQAESPAPFIGRVGYPHVNVGLLSPTKHKDNTWEYDAPRHWAKEKFSIPKVLDFRSSLVNSRAKVGVLESNKFIDLVKEVGIASKPVDVEVNLKSKPRFAMNFDTYTAPTGPKGEVMKAVATENAKVDRPVDRVVSDGDLKAVEAVKELYSKGFDENFLSKVLSVGSVGIEKNRRLVPTRWSITAVDDQIGKDLIQEIGDFNEADYGAYFGGHLGNYFLVLMIPDVWSFELFEMYLPKASWNQSDELQWTTDYESFKGRTSYAENCAGGYYASRLPVLEHLKSMKRRASCIVFRFITGEYTNPLGVWVVREATRNAMEGETLNFSDKDLMLKYASLLAKKKFGVDLDPILKESIILKTFNSQKKLSAFF